MADAHAAVLFRNLKGVQAGIKELLCHISGVGAGAVQFRYLRKQLLLTDLTRNIQNVLLLLCRLDVIENHVFTSSFKICSNLTGVHKDYLQSGCQVGGR